MGVNEQIGWLKPRFSDATCCNCRKPFERGDRVQIVYIFSHAGVDPMNLGRRGIDLGTEFEFAHYNCKDPKLIQGG